VIAGICDGDTVETTVDSVGDRVGDGLGRDVVSVEGGDVDDGDLIGWNVDIGDSGRNVGDIGRSVGGDSGDIGRSVGGNTLEIGLDVDTGGDNGLATGTGADSGGETGLATGTGAVTGCETGLATGTGAVTGGETGLATGTGAVTGGETGLATGTGIVIGAETGLATGLATGLDAMIITLSVIRCCSYFRPDTALWTKSLSCGLSCCRSLKKRLLVESLKSWLNPVSSFTLRLVATATLPVRLNLSRRTNFAMLVNIFDRETLALLLSKCASNLSRLYPRKPFIPAGPQANEIFVLDINRRIAWGK
jgi:hypothetical protein